jgi:hypothetical protein
MLSLLKLHAGTKKTSSRWGGGGGGRTKSATQIK